MIQKQINVVDKFLDIMSSEKQFFPKFDVRIINNANDFFNITSQILELGYLALVPRIYITRYNMAKDYPAFESVGAHTLLVETMVDRALAFKYDPGFKRTSDRFKYREIMEAIRRHDLPELIISDQPDNGTRDDKKLAKDEHRYWRFFSKLSPKREMDFEKKVNSLLLNMQNRHSITGRMLYVADKASLIIMALCCDHKKVAPVMHLNDPTASTNKITDMHTCDHCNKNGYFNGSEMWTVNFLKTRKLYQYDDSGFFTALIVMATLATHDNKWYRWRERDYTQPNQ